MACRPKLPTGEKKPSKFQAPIFVPTQDSADLQRMLASAFSNIAADLQGLHTIVETPPQTQPVTAVTGTIMAKAGDVLRLMPGAAGIQVLLPAARAANKGDDVSIIIVGGATGVVTVRAVEGRVQDASSVTLTGGGLRVFRSDGGDGTATGAGGWWIVGRNSADSTAVIIGIGAGTQTASSGTIVFGNSPTVTFGMNNGTITASAAGGGSGSTVVEGIILDPTEVLNFVRTSGTWDLETSHIDSDGTMGSTTTAGAVATTALATAPGALDRTIVECSIYCSSAGTFSVTAGGVTVLGPLSLTAGERVEFTSAQGWRVFNADGSEKTSASVGGGGVAISAAGNSVSAGTVVWSNSNNVSFGMAGSTITASVTVASTQGSFSFSAGTTNNLLSNLVFSNSNNVSFGLNGSTVTASATVAAPAATREIGIVSHIGGNVVSSVSQLAFSNASNVTFSLSTAANAATLIASVAAGGGGGVTLPGFEPYADLIAQTVQFVASNTMRLTINPIAMPAFTFDRLIFPYVFSLTTSTHSGSYRINVGIYTQNASTLSLLHSTTFSTAVTISTGNTTLFQGPGYISIPWSSSVSSGKYWLAAAVGSTSAGANASMNFFVISLHSTGNSRAFGVASNVTVQPILGQGLHSVSSSLVPGSIAFSNIIGSDFAGRSPVKLHFGSGTA